jgi:3-oxoacid CoA-transferase B subunit
VKEVKDGLVVNLGVGLPTYIKAFLPQENRALVHGENGVLGMVAQRDFSSIDVNTVDADKLPASIRKGGSTFSTALSFDMIRGGHIDVSILGGL